MDHLDDISVEELQHALNNVEENKPTQRLTAAITYKNGVTQTELAEWYGVERRTIYSWLKRLEQSRLSRLFRTIIGQEDRGSSPKNNKKQLDKRSSSHPLKQESTRRRFSTNSSKKRSTSTTQSLAVGG
jgi:transposase